VNEKGQEFWKNFKVDVLKFNDIEQKKISRMIKAIQACKTWDHVRKLQPKELLKVYTPLIGDPCYKYSRAAKEKFFSDPHLCYLFIRTFPYCKETFLSSNVK
jgi:hypothetical protein